jgi:quinoprotein glucose dehydrogenase
MLQRAIERRTKPRRWLAAGVLLAIALLVVIYHGYSERWFTPNPPIDMTGPIAGWDHWGGDAGGTRFSPLTQITPANVAALKPAWTYRIGMIKVPGENSPTLESTPIIADGRLYACSGITRIVAIDPETGREIWAFDPKSDNFSTYQLNCRGVTFVRDPMARPGEPCAARIVAGTLDARMVALDAATGRLCDAFGANGIIDLKQGLGKYERGDGRSKATGWDGRS